MHAVVRAMRIAGLAAIFVGLTTGVVSIAGAHQIEQDSPQALPAGSFGGPFVLVDQTGQEVTDQTFRGQLTVIYFGYTFCPDTCPIDAANIARAMDLLDPAADEVQPLFITIDPARDTPERLSEWLGAIHPRFVGLTGTEQSIATATTAFKVVYEKVESANGYDYTVSHPGLIYVMDKDGHFLFLLPRGTPPEVIAEELRAALAGKG